MQDELLPRQRAAQIHRQGALGLDPRIHFDFVEAIAVPAFVLGAVQRKVGAAHDVADAVHGGKRDADADMDVDLDAIDPEWL